MRIALALLLTAALGGCGRGSPSAAVAFTKVQVIDGDTVVIGQRTIHLAGIQSPALPPKAKCVAESALAIRARNTLQMLVEHHGPVEIVEAPSMAAPAGEVSARVIFRGETENTDLSEEMLEWKLAAPASPEPFDWCGPIQPAALGADRLTDTAQLGMLSAG